MLKHDSIQRKRET